MQASWLVGISDTSGYKICNEYGLSEYLIRRENLTDAEINEINKLYVEGYSYKSICEKMNISPNTVTIHTSSNRYNEYNDEQITLLCELVFVEKMSIREASEIADIRLHTARSICYKYKKKHNLI